jgi:hypothetical protein
MAHGATNEKLWRERNVCVLYFIHLVTLTDDIDNINLSSPYHYPSWKNSTLLSGSHWRPKKRIIAHFGPQGFRPRSIVKRGSATTPTVRTTVQCPIPTEKSPTRA